MRQYNLIGILFVIATIALFNFNWKYAKETILFYGFANNKELNINLKHPSTVKAIHVQSGQRVSEGDLLLEVTRSSIAVSQNDINHDILNLKAQYKLWASGLKTSIRKVKSQKLTKSNEIESAINKLESEMTINNSLIKDIASINQIHDNNGSNPRQIELDGLKADLRLVMNTFNVEIGRLEKELYNSENPLLIQINKLDNNLEFVNEEERDLQITAKNDGIVGTILCKVGENIEAFNPYLTIYKETPNHVKGYVLESLILEINENDTLSIQSLSLPDEEIKGVVVGMGSRIIEIPSRLRKHNSYTTYGREIEISIPADNQFLQNEKVILRKLIDKNYSLVKSDRSLHN